ncbi:hypothetical protein L210DRAFT_951667 [Boletus edulis BED1]|uniref:Uncharacterized protein n=1 Tax=Boletus edulis BED1 TaxID=1328754 RepID=A0AAD4BND5_BOLED|nr:hypothetical protein L210DRAFT_951667 [Boletus edulis BED1]
MTTNETNAPHHWQIFDVARATIEKLSAALPIEQRDSVLQELSPEELDERACLVNDRRCASVGLRGM